MRLWTGRRELGGGGEGGNLGEVVRWKVEMGRGVGGVKAKVTDRRVSKQFGIPSRIIRRLKRRSGKSGCAHADFGPGS